MDYVEWQCPDCRDPLFTRVCDCGYERTLADEFRFVYVPEANDDAWILTAMGRINVLPLYVLRGIRDGFEAGSFDPDEWFFARLAEEAAQLDAELLLSPEEMYDPDPWEDPEDWPPEPEA